MPFCDKSSVLTAHNERRALHGTPPLLWSDECALYAQRCAWDNQERNTMDHSFLKTETSRRRMGQCIFDAKQGCTDASSAIEFWYSEVDVYDFQNPGYQMGTSHFSAVVWHDTTHVGMASSDDGRFYVANYYPRGNVVGRANGREAYEQNVLPRGAKLSARPRNAREKKLFRQFDVLAKGNRKVPVSSVQHVFESLKEMDLLEALKSADTNGDGYLDPWEFVLAMTHSRDGDQDEDNVPLDHVVGFFRADDNCNLKLDALELPIFLSGTMGRKYTDEEIHTILSCFDADHDGLLDYAELRQLLDSGFLGKSPAEGGTVVIKEWSEDVERLLADLPAPSTGWIADLQKHVEHGEVVRVTRHKMDTLIEFSSKLGGWKRMSLGRAGPGSFSSQTGRV